MTISALPPAPQPTDSTSQFNTKAFTFLAALETFRTEANAQAVDVNTDAGTASTAATTATTQAGIATTQAGIATQAASDATGAATSAINAFDQFDDRYLGAKASDPTTDNDGDPLVTGALYYRTGVGMRVWTGSAWEAAYLPASNYLETGDIGVTVQAYDADLTTWAGKTAPTGAVVGTTDTQTLTNKTITGLRETRTAIGSSNIDLSAGNYFTRSFTAGAVSLTISNVPTSGTTASFILETTNAGLATITWPTNTRWAGGTAPTLTTSGKDILGAYTHDAGANWNFLVLGKDVK